MSNLADSPCPYRILHHPAGSIGGDAGGWGAELAFHVGVGVGGVATDITPFLTHVGGTVETTVIGGVAVERIVPLRHPYLPDMVAVEVRAEGTGRGIDAEPGWTDWRVSVRFIVPPFGFGGDTPYTVIRHRGASQAITLPGAAYAVSGVKLNHDVAIAIPEVLFSATMYLVPAVNLAVYQSLLNKVNNATFLDCPSETVRFDGFESELATTITFTQTRTVTLSLAYRPISWNQVLLPTGIWGTPININDSSKIYTPADLTPLLY